jgi:hypothetical protein
MSFISDLFRPNSSGASARAGQQNGQAAAAVSDPFQQYRGAFASQLSNLFANGGMPSYFTPGAGIDDITGSLPTAGAGLPTAGMGMADPSMLNPTAEQIQNDPVRAAQMRFATNATNNAAAANGTLNSGGTLAALQQNAADITANAGDRLYGRNLNTFNATNQAQQQNFLQGMGVQGTNFSQALQNAGFRLGAQGQTFGQGNSYINTLTGLAGATPQNAMSAGGNMVQGFANGTQAQTSQNNTAGNSLNMLGNIGSWLFSDVRTKENIQHVGTTKGGLPIYTYRYRAGGPVCMGVMAQDVEKVTPEAVAEHPSGYKMVNYGMVH